MAALPGGVGLRGGDTAFHTQVCRGQNLTRCQSRGQYPDPRGRSRLKCAEGAPAPEGRRPTLDPGGQGWYKRKQALLPMKLQVVWLQRETSGSTDSKETQRPLPQRPAKEGLLGRKVCGQGREGLPPGARSGLGGT